MQYEQFNHLITLKYCIVIEGWPAGLEFQCPSKFHGDTDKLLPLHEAWKSGSTCFRKLTPNEFNEWTTARAKGLADGTIQVKAQQPRSDAGVKRKKTAGGNELKSEKDDDDSEEDEGNSESDDELVDGPTKMKTFKKDRSKLAPHGPSVKTSSGKTKGSSKNQKSQAAKTATTKKQVKTAVTKKQATKKNKKEQSVAQAHAELTIASDLIATEATDQNSIAPVDLPSSVLGEASGTGDVDDGDLGNARSLIVEDPALVISTPPSTAPHGRTAQALFSHVGSPIVLSHAEVTNNVPTPLTAFSNLAIDPALWECSMMEGTRCSVDNSVPASQPTQTHQPFDNSGPADNPGPTAHVESGHSTTPAAPSDDAMPTSRNTNRKRPRDLDSRTGENEEEVLG
ncbi:hypothetical protein PQX77_007944 [Marasmius sp. AFHP31]|nr:hypothetical protein PQX77_007944 [Marasmius sp. AFHP31]